jgi:hypothetical protein
MFLKLEKDLRVIDKHQRRAVIRAGQGVILLDNEGDLRRVWWGDEVCTADADRLKQAAGVQETGHA